MVFGLSLAAFTQAHVVISIIGIAGGLIFFAALSGGRWLSWANEQFLVFTILTSVTGFLFPPKPIGPPFIFGVVSLVLLAIALFALYGQGLRGPWRVIYLVTALVAQWLNMVVLVVQSYQKIPSLHALAPLGTEPAILASQGVVVVILAYFAWMTLRRRVVAAS